MIGRFYFKRTSNGNLLGEFSNNYSSKIEAELALPEKPTVDFVGVYKSTWVDTINGAVLLTIQQKKNTANRLFTMTWQEAGVITFWGEGMLCDDVLVGDYRDFLDIPD